MVGIVHCHVGFRGCSVSCLRSILNKKAHYRDMLSIFKCQGQYKENGCPSSEEHFILEPQTTIKKWMFGETTISYVKIGNHPIETTIYKWLLGVPG